MEKFFKSFLLEAELSKVSGANIQKVVDKLEKKCFGWKIINLVQYFAFHYLFNVKCTFLTGLNTRSGKILHQPVLYLE